MQEKLYIFVFNDIIVNCEIVGWEKRNKKTDKQCEFYVGLKKKKNYIHFCILFLNFNI